MLEVRGLQVVYNDGMPSAVHALQGIDLDVEDGSFVVVIGTNNSGKSTLLNAIGGLAPITSGTVRLNGQDLTHLPEHRRAFHIGRVGPNPAGGTAPNLTIADHLALAARRGQRHTLRLNLSPWRKAEFIEPLEALGTGFEERLRVPAGKLSPAERQMLALLTVTWRRPELLLLDDPTGALDPANAERVLGLTRKLVERERLTTLLATQSMLEAVNLGDRLLMLDNGRIVRDLRGAQKRRLRVDDLLTLFQEVRCSDLLDESAAELLRRSYI